MTSRLGGSTWEPIITRSARSCETHAPTQALESSVFFHSSDGIRSYCGKSYQTTTKLSRELGPRIGPQGGRVVGHRSMGELFCVRINHHTRPRRHADVFTSVQILWVTWRKYLMRDFKTRCRSHFFSSFGGGLELMKAGGDKDGIWILLHAGLRCVFLLRCIVCL